jgi:6-pyruvoyltetrahydropterin/6-carboxytetrahydropterin synthase
VSYSVVVRHRFEAAHRLPHLGSACANVHGHSWQAAVTVTSSELASDGTVAEFGAFKGHLRSWIDTHLGNGAMLGAADPLLPAFDAGGSRTFRFGLADDAPGAEALAGDQPWPTVEAVAVVIARAASQALAVVPHAPGAVVTEVRLAETPVNAAIWRAEVLA